MRARGGFEPGSLRDGIRTVTARALASGALQPIPTGCEFVEDGGVRFFVRVLASLARKAEDRARRAQEAAGGKPANPFLPYEEDLFVAGVSEHHVAILNKFNVVHDHLLIVTREFEDQRSLLTLRDFEAWWRCLGEYESLGFYNGGVEAGASQSHKHLQLVPLPLAPEGPAVPIGPLLAEARGAGDFLTIPGFDFLHSFSRLGGNRRAQDRSAVPPGAMAGARDAHERYRAMLGRVGLGPSVRGGAEWQSGPYCLLVTREWMLLVPRSREFFGSISVNALGFAGALLVRDDEQLRALKAAGPFAALRETAAAAPKGAGAGS